LAKCWREQHGQKPYSRHKDYVSEDLRKGHMARRKRTTENMVKMRLERRARDIIYKATCIPVYFF